MRKWTRRRNVNLPHSKKGWDKSMRKPLYQSLDVLNGSQAFPHRKRLKAIPLDGIASHEMLGSSNIGYVAWLRSILVDRASKGTSPHDTLLGTVQMPMALCVLLWERVALDRQQLGLKTAE